MVVARTALKANFFFAGGGGGVCNREGSVFVSFQTYPRNFQKIFSSSS